MMVGSWEARYDSLGRARYGTAFASCLDCLGCLGKSNQRQCQACQWLGSCQGRKSGRRVQSAGLAAGARGTWDSDLTGDCQKLWSYSAKGGLNVDLAEVGFRPVRSHACLECEGPEPSQPRPCRVSTKNLPC